MIIYVPGHSLVFILLALSALLETVDQPFFLSFGDYTLVFPVLTIPCQSCLSIFSFSTGTVSFGFSQFCLSHLYSSFMTLIAAYRLMTLIKPLLSFTLIIVKTQWISPRFLIFSMSLSEFVIVFLPHDFLKKIF